MLKTTLFIWCLLVASSSYNNAELAIQNYHPEYNPDSPLFIHPMYQQQQHDDEQYFSPNYFFRQEVESGFRNASEPNIAGRTKIGNRKNQSNPGSSSINYQLSTAGQPVPGEQDRPIIAIPSRVVNPTSQTGPDFKQRPTPILNRIRQFLQRFLALLSRLFPNIISVTTITVDKTISSTITCTASTTFCARRRRRAVINQIINHNTSEDQLDGEMFSFINPVNESSLASMKLLDKGEANPELNLYLINYKSSNIEGSMYNPEDEEEIALLRKELKMSPFQAALLAKQFGHFYLVVEKVFHILFTNTVMVPCLNQNDVICPP